MKNSIKNIIKKAIDIHVHIGPEVIPRKFETNNLVKTEEGKITGFVLKNHFFSTIPFIKDVEDKTKLKLFGSIVLNNSVGGLNEEAIYSSSSITNKPIMVYFPTINAKNFLDKSKYEIAPEWVNNKNFKGRKSRNVKAVEILKDNKLLKETTKILEFIKKEKYVLATGHISWRESKILVDSALKKGVKKIVITHPIYQKIRMPIKVQKELARLGCYIEQSYSMYSIDRIPIKKIARQIKEVGVNSVILSSDVGQVFSPSPSKALYNFCLLLSKEGIDEDGLYRMLVTNPKKLLSIE